MTGSMECQRPLEEGRCESRLDNMSRKGCAPVAVFRRLSPSSRCCRAFRETGGNGRGKRFHPNNFCCCVAGGPIERTLVRPKGNELCSRQKEKGRFCS